MGCFSGVEKNWSSLTDVGRTHIATKGTVQSGLVLNLDAGVSSSYSGSGTTWNDLSGNGNNGTLVNGVGYTSSNGGSLSFNGSNQYGTIPFNSNFAFGTGDFTVEVWMLMTSTSNIYQILGGTHSAGSSGSGWYYYARNTNLAGGQSFGYISDIQNNQSAISTNMWIQMVARRISGVLTFYQNATQGASVSFADNIVNGGALILGNLGGSGFPTTYGFTGNISVVRVYKGKGLSASEVSQNFQALRNRYGI